ncbi:hydrogenase subunit MbhD domain-containing protein [Hydrogenophaga sp.]|uniref:hydrogenase subunit MbhD domain-containing protein n=1 Tax=Hydrogenophaga sp. TaxID=1904254 RepID=UPI0019C685A8|nr:hydrogenase subunit MbhD domain-containing protein [Hydrogenophaga sp.]MBD3893748.1 DUF4040 domain-containing protein [Hydrogenophaga sp.]
MSLAFDTLLVAALLWSAWRALAAPELVRAVVLFIVFGLLMTLAWVRLDAPDLALAEAAIGAGLTGALLLDALGVPATTPLPQRRAVRWLLLTGLAALGAGLLLAVLQAPLASQRVAPLLEAQMASSGVTHPVTAVLLNFRAYDTLLEVAVLLVALLGLLALGRHPQALPAPASADPLLQTLARLLTPLMILVAGYMLWAGAHQPGGAFQAAAVLGAAAVLLHLAGLLPAWGEPSRLLRLGLAAGFGLFLLLAALLLSQGALLLYPPAWAGALILLIEAGLTLSLGLLLAGLYLLLAQQRGLP